MATTIGDPTKPKTILAGAQVPQRVNILKNSRFVGMLDENLHKRRDMQPEKPHATHDPIFITDIIFILAVVKTLENETVCTKSLINKLLSTCIEYLI